MFNNKSVYLIGLLLAVLLLTGCEGRSTAGESCLVRPIVRNAYTDEPVEGAEVIIAELEKVYVTDATGSVPWTEVCHGPELPVLYTLVAEAEGYLPCLLYFVCPADAEPLNGPMIYLFPEGKESVPSTAMVYAPEEDYTRSLIQKIKNKVCQQE